MDVYDESRWYCPRCGQPNRADGKPCGWCSHWPGWTDTGRLMDRDRTPKSWELGPTPWKRKRSRRR